MGKKQSKVSRYKRSLLSNKAMALPWRRFLCVYNHEMDWMVCEHAEWSIVKTRKNPDPDFFIELNFDFEKEQIFY